jgi:clan AA aspartic protease
MKGHVDAGRAWLPVPLHHFSGRFVVEFQVDTGFAGWLSIPPAAMTKLNLPFLENQRPHLVDGSVVVRAMHRATIEWFGIEMDVPVLSIGERPLIGAALLDGCELVVEYEQEGEVRLSPL